MSTEDEKLLKEAKKLPWEDRLLHTNWKVRSDANIDLAALFESITDPKDPRIRELGHFFKKTVADSNEQVQDKALDALIAYLKAADADAARYAKDVCDAVVAKCLTGQMKTVEKAQMVFMLWVELEAVDVFLDAMEKAIKHEVAKAVVPAIDVMFQALSEFGSKIVPPKRILKMLPELFDHQDQNVRASCKGLMLELCRWIGRDPVKSVLFEKMRDEMKKELEAELDNVSGGAAAKPSRKIRSEQDKEPEQKAEEATAEIPHEIDELVDPVDILTPLEKSGFWNGVKPTKPKEARPKLTNLASTKRDFSEICPTLNKEMVCKICLLDNRSYEISCNDATTVSDAVQEVARLVKLSTHSGFGVFKDENVCFCGNANYIPLHENKKLIDVLAELNVKDKLIFKIKVFRDEAITDPVFLYMSFVQLKHDYVCGNYSCISQGDVEQLSSLLILAQYGAGAKSETDWYKILNRSKPQYLNRKYCTDGLKNNITQCYLSLEKMNKEDAVHSFVSILSKLPYGKSIFYNTKIIGDNTKIIGTKHKKVIVGVNKVGVHLFGLIQHRRLLHSIEMKDIRQFGSSKTRFILKTRDYKLEFETELAEEMCLTLKTHVQDLTGTKASSTAATADSDISQPPNANINLDSRDEAFKQREDEVKEVGILRGELQQVREDHERQLQQVREDHERQLQQVREDHERQLQGLTSELARFKKYVGCIVAEVDKLIIKSCALEETCSPQRHQISVLEHQLKINLYRSMMEKEGIDGVQDIMKAYKAAHEEIDDSTDEHVPDGASSALINRVDAVQQKLEKDIDDMDAKIGDDWRVLDRDYDGQVTSASATASLKDAMAKDKATSEEENQKPTGESSSCVLDDDEEEEHSPLVFKAAESFYSVLDNEQEREQVDEDEEHEDEEDDEDEQDEEYEDEEHEDEEPLPDVADETVGDVGKEKCHFDKGGMFDHKKELTLNKLIIEAHAPHQVLKVLSDAKRSSLSPLSPLNLETSLEFIAKKMDQISMTMSRRLAFARRRKMRVLVAMSMAALPQLSAKGISNLAWALSKIGGELLYLPEMDRVAEVGLTKVADFDSEDIATVALAFASMKHSAPRLFTELSKRASDIVSTFQPQELTEVLWAFAYLYEAKAAEELLACLDQFTFDNNECLQRDWLVLEFNYSQLRNVCWSYAVLGQMNRTFFFHIWKILGHFQEQISEDKKILLVHQCLKFEYPYLSSLNKYIDETCIPAEEITRSEEYLSSSFHKKVRRFLAKTILDSTKEYFVDGYTLDPSLVDLKVVLAIVGPNHYSRNLGNALGYTVLLHRHYEATGWKVVTVPHEEWQGLKGTDKQRDYMREIIHGQGG